MLLNRYIYKSMFKPMLFGILGCTFLILLDTLSEMIENIIVRHVSFVQVIELMSYLMIHLLSFTIPMGVMIGALVTYGSLSNDNELVAMNSLGVSLFEMIKPILVVSSMLSIFLLSVNQFIVPFASQRQEDISKKLAYDNPSLGLGAKQFVDSIRGYAIYLDEFNSKENIGKNFIIFSNENGDPFSSIVVGKNIEWKDGHMSMINSRAYRINSKGENEAFVKFSQQSIPIKSKISGFDSLGSQDIENQMSLTSLLFTIIDRKKKHFSATRYSMALHTKLSLSFSPIIMALLGSLLAAGVHKRFKKGDGKLTGIGILFIYWIWIMSSKGIIMNNNYPSYIMWIPNVIFLILSLVMFSYKRRR